MSQALASGALRRSRNLTEEVVAELSERIRSGALQPGDKLPTESEIMAQLGVSRTVVRESISRLQAARLVQTRHGIGTFVLEAGDQDRFQIDSAGDLTVRDVMAILELRISLETECAGLAAQRAKPEDIARIRAALDTLATKRGNASDSVEADLGFHVAVARATGNRYFVDILVQLGTALIPRERVDSASIAREDPSAYLSLVNREHESIFDAIARRDAESARAAMRMHLSNSRERLRRANQHAATDFD